MANGIRKSRLLRDIERHKRVFGWREIAERWPHMQLRNLSPRYWDSEYVALPRGVWTDILQYSGIDEFRYVRNVSDCDKFAGGLKFMTALKLRVNGFILIADYDAGHGYNGMLEAEKGDPIEALRIPIVEPQSDELVTTASPLYSLTNGEAIL